MSASLVGSEMCIRDSLSTNSSCAAAGTHPESARLVRNPARMHTQNSTPVSYTHLTLPTICSV
eukprot:12570392-Alexandrium_andersonii.AAC.1